VVWFQPVRAPEVVNPGELIEFAVLKPNSAVFTDVDVEVSTPRPADSADPLRDHYVDKALEREAGHDEFVAVVSDVPLKNHGIAVDAVVQDERRRVRDGWALSPPRGLATPTPQRPVWTSWREGSLACDSGILHDCADQARFGL
jgi:hypothetical protein